MNPSRSTISTHRFRLNGRSILGGLAAAIMAAFAAPSTAHADYFVDFEGAGEMKTGYASGTVSLSGIPWDLTEVLIGTATADWKNGDRSARLRGRDGSAMTMLEDKSNGAGTISFSYRRYGTDGSQQPWQVEYSTNAGGAWIPVGAPITATATVQNFSEAVEVEGDIRFRIRIDSTPGNTGDRRMNIDDILITDFGTVPFDVVALNPPANSLDVPVNTQLTLTFNRPPSAGNGSVILRQAQTVTETFPAIAGVIDGNSVTFTPSAPLNELENYFVLVDGDAFVDDDGVPFAGFSIGTEWGFVTAGPDVDGPVPVTLVPANGATDVDLDTEEIRILFDEPIFIVGNGTIEIRRLDDDVVVDAVPVDDFSSVLEGDANEMIVLLLPEIFEFDTAYYVTIPAGSVEDETGNPNLAFGAPTSDIPWVFTIESEPLPPPSIPLEDGTPYTQDFAGFTGTNGQPAILPVGWFAEGPRLNYNGDWAATTPTTAGFRGNANVLGYQHSGDTDDLVKGVRMRNETGAEINDLVISYRGRVARANQGRSPVYTVEVDGVVVPGLSYSTLEGDSVLKQVSIGGLNIPAGAVFFITWTSERGESTGSSKQIGISEFSISTGSAVFAPSLGVTSVVPESINQTSFQVVGNVTGDGGAAITTQGFVYAETALNADPVIGGDSVLQLNSLSPGVGQFSAFITGLDPATSYSVRAFATNAEGTTYSAVVTASTLPPAPSFLGEYTQPFNNFDGNLPMGWTAISSGGVQAFTGDWGGNNTGGFRGNVSNPGVLGYQHNTSSGTLTVTLNLINDTGATIDELYIGYLGRVARIIETRHPEWTVAINGLEVPELAYSTAGGVDESKLHQVTGLGITEGETFSITWVSSGNVGTGGGRRQIGIADVFVGLEAPAPPSDDDFAAWIAGFPGVGSLTGPFDTPAGDGVPNILKHVLGLAPDVAVTGALVTTSDAGPGEITFVHTRIKPAALASDAIFAYEWSTNLADWAADGATLGGVTVDFGTPTVLDDSNSNFDLVEVTATVTEGSADRLFIRIAADVEAAAE